jgi:tetratricopeptide (TPR) repeat protein
MRRPVIPTTEAEIRADFAALLAQQELDRRHDDQVQRNDEERAAFRYRTAGVERAKLGDNRGAVLYFQLAVGAVASDPDSLASAAARHDLAMALSADPTGHVVRDAVVRDLLEAVVENPLRRQYARRWAGSANLLASTLRSLAEDVEEDDGGRSVLLERADDLFRQAIDAAEDARSWVEAAAYWLNLGNLRSDRDDIAGAIAAYQRGLECVDPFGDKAPKELTRLLVNLAHSRQKRDRPGDKAKSRSLLERASRMSGPDAVKANLALAETAVAERKRERAVTFLRALDLRWLPVESYHHVADLHERVGVGQLMIEKLNLRIDQLLSDRATTIADLPSDRVSLQIQSSGLVLAQALLRHGRPVEAFLAIENVSALRFSEVTWRPSGSSNDERIEALLRDRGQHGTIAGRLEDILDRLQVVPIDEWLSTLGKLARDLSTINGDASSPYPAIVRALLEATRSGQLRLEPIVRALDEAASKSMNADAEL